MATSTSPSTATAARGLDQRRHDRRDDSRLPTGVPGADDAYFGDIAVLNGSVYSRSSTGGGLMKADGQGGAAPVPLPAGVTASPFLTAVGNRLYFMADDGAHEPRCGRPTAPPAAPSG